MRLLTLQIVLFLTDSNNSFLFIQCSYFHTCLHHFFLRFVFFTFLILFSSARDTFYNLVTLIDSNSLQPAFNFAIFHTESFHYKLQTTFQKKKETKKKNCNLLKNMFCLHYVSTTSLSLSLAFCHDLKFSVLWTILVFSDYFLNEFQFP